MQTKGPRIYEFNARRQHRRAAHDVQKVDERLVVLAEGNLRVGVVTNDFNLNKICQVQSVEVINLNELANAMKVVALPGERLPVKIVKQEIQAPGKVSVIWTTGRWWLSSTGATRSAGRCRSW